jgi:hypothetical protein
MAYQGPGDLTSGAVAWMGTRAYNAAYATGSNPCMDIVDGSGANLTTINISSTGAVDYTTISNFISAHGSALCSKMYDQTGNGHHLTQGTNAARPSVVVSPTGLGSNQVALQLTTAQFMPGTGNIPTQSLPITMTAMLYRTGNTANPTPIAQLIVQSGVDSIFIGGDNVVNSIRVYGGVTPTFAAADNAWHAAGFKLAGGAISVVALDNVLTTGQSAGANTPDNTGTFNLSNSNPTNALAGSVTEIGYWPSGWVNATLQSWSNQASGNTSDGSVTYYFSAAPTPSTTIVLMGAICM